MAGSQVVKIIIVTVKAGASPVKLDLGAGLGAAGHPVQEPLELIVSQLSAELPGLGHLTQHGLHLPEVVLLRPEIALLRPEMVLLRPEIVLLPTCRPFSGLASIRVLSRARA